jgi:hypothetical protein
MTHCLTISLAVTFEYRLYFNSLVPFSCTLTIFIYVVSSQFNRIFWEFKARWKGVCVLQNCLSIIFLTWLRKCWIRLVVKGIWRAWCRLPCDGPIHGICRQQPRSCLPYPVKLACALSSWELRWIKYMKYAPFMLRCSVLPTRTRHR